MSYNDFEISNQDGRPVWFYEFRLSSKFWRYTSADRDIVWGLDVAGEPITWKAVAINHDSITQGGNENNDLQVPMQLDLPIVSVFRVNSPTLPVWLTIRRRHYDDPSDEAPVAWIGTVGNIQDEGDGVTARAYCNSIAATFDRNGVWLFWSRGCPLALYGRGCGVDPADHAYVSTVAASNVVSVTTATDMVATEGSFSGGYLEWTRADGVTERRAIEIALDERRFDILGQIEALPVGTPITLYPGCSRTTANCKLFDNLPNYGGFPHLPGKSPFDGTPVF